MFQTVDVGDDENVDFIRDCLHVPISKKAYKDSMIDFVIIIIVFKHFALIYTKNGYAISNLYQ